MVTSLIKKGKGQGFLLSDDVMAAFPNAEEHIESLDDFYSTLVEEGIEVVDQVPAILPSEFARPPPRPRDTSIAERHDAAEDTIATVGVGDSVRLYLQEIGDTDLLTMQEEVWLAKRMERGKLA